MSKNSGLSLSEAMELLTVGEIQAMERHYERSFESGKLSGTDLTAGVVWALERRNDLKENKTLTNWSDIENWTMKNLDAYFVPEAIEVDPSNPESDEGKGD